MDRAAPRCPGCWERHGWATGSRLEGGWGFKLGCLEGFAGKSKDPKEWGGERPEALVYLETVLQTEGTAFAKPWRQSCRSWGGGGEERAGEGSVLGEEGADEGSGLGEEGAGEVSAGGRGGR